MGFAIFDEVYTASKSALDALETEVKRITGEITKAAKAPINEPTDTDDGENVVGGSNPEDQTGGAQAGASTEADEETTSSTSALLLLLQKNVGEWTVTLGTSTSLLKSLSDGLQGVTRNI